MNIRVYRNKDVKRVIAFIPPNHHHVRLYIEFLDDSSIILQEATVSGIVRAFMNVVHHPLNRVCELVSKRLDERKDGYAEYQLIESDRSVDEILKEVKEICEEDTHAF